MTTVREIRMTPQTRFVLLLLLQDPEREWYGVEVANRLGLYHGTAGGVLTRLERAGWATLSPHVGVRGRLYFRLTHDGAVAAQAEVRKGLTPVFKSLARSLNLSTDVLTAPITISNMPTPAPKPTAHKPTWTPNDALTARELGSELRRRRKLKGWNRRQLLERLHDLDVSVQTVATWELGTRALSVIRLFQLCHVLGVPPHEVIAHTERAISEPDEPDVVTTVSLDQLASTTRPELAPARRWAARAAHEHDTGHHVQLSNEALTTLAGICGMTTADLLAALRDTGESDGG